MRKGKNKRKHKRVPAQIGVKVLIESPTLSFPPQTKNATIIDVGQRGMTLKVHNVPSEFHNQMEEDCRFVDITLTFPQTKQTRTLLGKIVWSTCEASASECMMGVHFETMSPEHLSSMIGLINHLETQQPPLMST